MPPHRLVYASRFGPAFPLSLDLQAQEVRQIISRSIENNRRRGLTGLLLVNDGWFLQVLEGAAEKVMTTYGIIERDPRHVHPMIISAGAAPSREFGAWHMCARSLSPADDAILDTLALRAPIHPAGLTPESAIRLLRVVRNIKLDRGAVAAS